MNFTFPKHKMYMLPELLCCMKKLHYQRGEIYEYLSVTGLMCKPQLSITNTMFENKGVHKWHQDTLGQRSMIDFAIVSDLYGRPCRRNNGPQPQKSGLPTPGQGKVIAPSGGV